MVRFPLALVPGSEKESDKRDSRHPVYKNTLPKPATFLFHRIDKDTNILVPRVYSNTDNITNGQAQPNRRKTRSSSRLNISTVTFVSHLLRYHPNPCRKHMVHRNLDSFMSCVSKVYDPWSYQTIDHSICIYVYMNHSFIN